MELHNIDCMKATQNLLSARRQLEEVKAYEKKLRDEFATAILLDAIEQPSRVLRLDTYWRRTGLLPMDVEKMVVNLLDKTDNPDFMGLKTTRHAIRHRYAELDETGTPTGGFVEKVDETPIIVNLGEVKPPRKCTVACRYNVMGSGKCANGNCGRCSAECKECRPQEVVMGRASLLSDAPLCKHSECYYVKHGVPCPNEERPGTMWKCSSNWLVVQDLVDKILNQTPGTQPSGESKPPISKKGLR